MLPVSLLVRLWVEMHFFISQKNHSFVSLLVRLWVEISKNSHIDTPFTSASLWGCELKYNLYHGCCLDDLSASLWGCELKCQSWHHKCHPVPRQPPCEAVSWYFISCEDIFRLFVSLLVRLWVEMSNPNSSRTFASNVSLLVRLWVEIISWYVGSTKDSRQPPCEAVSWNAWCPFTEAAADRQPPCEAVSWNIKRLRKEQSTRSQPPCEAVSWNSKADKTVLQKSCQPPCEAVSWNT